MISRVAEPETESDESMTSLHAGSHDSKSTPNPHASSKPPRTWLQIGIWVALIAVGVAIGRFATFGASHSAGTNHELVSMPSDTAALSIPEGTIVVTAEPIVQRAIERRVDSVGNLHGYEEITLSSKAEGRVARIYHDLASIVHPGDLLLELDSTDAKLAVDQSERSLQAELAKWGLSQVPSEDEDLNNLPTVVMARLKYDLARSRLDRMIPLHRSNAVSADDLEQAKTDSQVTESDWKNQQQLAKSAAATARLRAAELAISKQRLRDCEIRAPRPTLTDNTPDQVYSICERMVSEGTLLRTGTEVFRLILGKKLKLKLTVPELYTGKIAIGQPVAVHTNAWESSVPGTVSKISPSVDRQTRTFIVEVEVPNEDCRLKPGSFAKASIIVGSDGHATTVPLASIYSLAGINKIFLIEAGVAREYQVTLGEQTNEWVEIAAPALPADAKVVTSGQRNLSNGVAVAERSMGEVILSEVSKGKPQGSNSGEVRR